MFVTEMSQSSRYNVIVTVAESRIWPAAAALHCISTLAGIGENQR